MDIDNLDLNFLVEGPPDDPLWNPFDEPKPPQPLIPGLGGGVQDWIDDWDAHDPLLPGDIIPDGPEDIPVPIKPGWEAPDWWEFLPDWFQDILDNIPQQEEGPQWWEDENMPAGGYWYYPSGGFDDEGNPIDVLG